MNINFLSSGRLSDRNDVTSNNVNFRPNIRQCFALLFFSEKVKTSRVSQLLKQFRATVLCLISNLGKHMIVPSRTLVVFKEHLIAVCLAYFAYTEAVVSRCSPWYVLLKKFTIFKGKHTQLYLKRGSETGAFL